MKTGIFGSGGISIIGDSGSLPGMTWIKRICFHKYDSETETFNRNFISGEVNNKDENTQCERHSLENGNLPIRRHFHVRRFPVVAGNDVHEEDMFS